ncbi:hypothetical protein PR048_018945 [Dryococelus australis]|uniref:Major facilitator superfamily (MFS) profile domain-containing protein n=1 Tax=Dryococelus australis TaxID=614101 RepID=A0ABQ9H238_9NEOP|nr:hypothetical protein PR048_018945 [Dryococelus australis]
MEQCRNERAGKTEDRRVNPPTSGIKSNLQVYNDWEDSIHDYFWTRASRAAWRPCLCVYYGVRSRLRSPPCRINTTEPLQNFSVRRSGIGDGRAKTTGKIANSVPPCETRACAVASPTIDLRALRRTRLELTTPLKTKASAFPPQRTSDHCVRTGKKPAKMPKSSSSFYTSNMSIASELGLERAKDFVKGSLKALNIGGSTEHRITPECELPILKSSGSENSLGQERERIEGWTPMLVLTGVATTVGCSVPVGYNIGVMNTPAAIIKEFCNATVFSTYGTYLSEPQMNILWSVIVSIFLIGGVTGSLTGGWVADRFGRQVSGAACRLASTLQIGAVVMNGVLSLFAALLFMTCRLANSVEMLLLARLIIGLASGLTTCTIPMYLTEIAPLSIRGAMGVLCPLGLTVGVIFAQVLGLKQVLGQENTWPYLLGLYAVLILVSSLALPFLPESPKYLYIVKGQEERGVRELTRLRGLAPEQLQDELEDMRQANKAELEAGSSWTFGSVLHARTLRLPLLLVCALQAGQQFSGINAVFYYSMTIFENAGLSHDGAQYASIGAGGVNLLVAIIAIPLVNRCGRRPLALWSCFTAAICLVLLCFCITYIVSVCFRCIGHGSGFAGVIARALLVSGRVAQSELLCLGIGLCSPANTTVIVRVDY